MGAAPSSECGILLHRFFSEFTLLVGQRLHISHDHHLIRSWGIRHAKRFDVDEVLYQHCVKKLLVGYLVSEPREEQFYVMCLATAISGPRLIRAWKRRYWIEYCFRTLKHLLATGACQVHSEDVYYGHLVLRLMGCLVLFYTSRVVCKGRLTLEEII